MINWTVTRAIVCVLPCWFHSGWLIWWYWEMYLFLFCFENGPPKKPFRNQKERRRQFEKPIKKKREKEKRKKKKKILVTHKRWYSFPQTPLKRSPNQRSHWHTEHSTYSKKVMINSNTSHPYFLWVMRVKILSLVFWFPSISARKKKEKKRPKQRSDGSVDRTDTSLETSRNVSFHKDIVYKKKQTKKDRDLPRSPQ